MSLAGNVGKLTDYHPMLLEIGDRDVFVKCAPLLDQLQAAIYPNKRGGAGGSGGGDPLNLTAFKLWEEVHGDIVIHTQDMGLPLLEDDKAALRQWATIDDADQFFEHVTLDWCDKISDLVSPIKPWHPQTPCPACQQRFYLSDDDIRKPVLSVHYLSRSGSMLHPEQWSADCGRCGAQWVGKEVQAIAHTE